MKILIELTYYRPHTSGLTIYAERLAKAFVQKGHAVTVLTSQYEKSLPHEEVLDGVRIVRVPVILRVSKGVIMPTFGWWASKLVREHDVLHLHLPQLDAAGLAFRGHMHKKPTVITYHCDLKMPRGVLSWAANQGVHVMNHIAGIFTHRIVTYTQDYADHSKYINHFKDKLAVINPPVELPEIEKKEIQRFKKKYNPDNNFPIIGMAARFAAEKGVEVVLDALNDIVKKFPKAQVWFAGPFQNILGEQKYLQKLIPIIQHYQISGNWNFVGLLSPKEMAGFFKNIDMLTIPSLNSTEAFGLVQIEAMMNGVPIIASDLPGVRQPVLRHNMGKIIPIGDSKALARAVIEIAENKNNYTQHFEEIQKQYAPSLIAQKYIDLFDQINLEINPLVGS